MVQHLSPLSVLNKRPSLAGLPLTRPVSRQQRAEREEQYRPKLRVKPERPPSPPVVVELAATPPPAPAPPSPPAQVDSSDGGRSPSPPPPAEDSLMGQSSPPQSSRAGEKEMGGVDSRQLAGGRHGVLWETRPSAFLFPGNYCCLV